MQGTDDRTPLCIVQTKPEQGCDGGSDIDLSHPWNPDAVAHTPAPGDEAHVAPAVTGELSSDPSCHRRLEGRSHRIVAEDEARFGLQPEPGLGIGSQRLKLAGRHHPERFGTPGFVRKHPARLDGIGFAACIDECRATVRLNDRQPGPDPRFGTGITGHEVGSQQGDVRVDAGMHRQDGVIAHDQDRRRFQQRAVPQTGE